jgi:hypothetical protein
VDEAWPFEELASHHKHSHEVMQSVARVLSEGAAPAAGGVRSRRRALSRKVFWMESVDLSIPMSGCPRSCRESFVCVWCVASPLPGPLELSERLFGPD